MVSPKQWLRHRWSAAFCLLAAGVFTVPLFYSKLIFFPLASGAADTDTLRAGLALLSALLGIPLLVLCFAGLGGCCAAFARLTGRRPDRGFIVSDIGSGILRHLPVMAAVGMLLGLTDLYLQYYLCRSLHLGGAESIRSAFAFLQTLLLEDADNGILRELLARSGNLTVMLAMLFLAAAALFLGYYMVFGEDKPPRRPGSFRLSRRFVTVVLLQGVPLTLGFASFAQLLSNFRIAVSPIWAVLVWSAGYLALLSLFVQRISKHKEQIRTAAAAQDYGAVRTFFYIVLHRTKTIGIPLFLWSTVCIWNDVLVPYFTLRKTGFLSPAKWLFHALERGQQALYAGVLAFSVATAAAALLFYSHCRLHRPRGMKQEVRGKTAADKQL
ncbi:MAG: hypothetical protein LBR73_02235 [Oscillospiraceae bacterium]|nr:hypothetical protein [Oscillospiraceae bacterium]